MTGLEWVVVTYVFCALFTFAKAVIALLSEEARDVVVRGLGPHVNDVVAVCGVSIILAFYVVVSAVFWPYFWGRWLVTEWRRLWAMSEEQLDAERAAKIKQIKAALRRGGRP